MHSVLVPDTAAYCRARTLAAQPRAAVPVRRMRLRHRSQDQAETVAPCGGWPDYTTELMPRP